VRIDELRAEIGERHVGAPGAERVAARLVEAGVVVKLRAVFASGTSAPLVASAA